MKRCFDFFASTMALILLAPLLVVTALLVRWRLGSPVLFRQQRLGVAGNPFVLFKFRTMTSDVDGHGLPRPDHLRLTPLGRFLRKSSLDELPELLNVLRGEMSLVGPRPLLLRYYPYFSAEEMVRFAVRPGITGLAQISGRNDLSWDQRMAADIHYVDHWSFGLDLLILLKTAAMVISRQGVKVDPMSAMMDFDEERRRRGDGPFR